jgi:hypothetical protein
MITPSENIGKTCAAGSLAMTIFWQLLIAASLNSGSGVRANVQTGAVT